MKPFCIFAAVVALLLSCVSCSEKYVEDTTPIPLEAVDLGLPSGVLWASQNLYANRPEFLGGTFAWGETQLKSVSSDYSFMQNGKLTAYNFYEELGEVDNRYILDAGDDAAAAVLGPDWRMPTEWDVAELFAYCTVETKTLNGIVCLKLTSTVNANSILIPSYKDYESFMQLVGDIFTPGPNTDMYSYWTSCLSDDKYDLNRAACSFSPNERKLTATYRNNGLYIRPVRSRRAAVEMISLEITETKLSPAQTAGVAVSYSPLDALDKRINWTSSEKTVAYVDAQGTVTALTPGNATIVAESVSSGQTSSLAVSVGEFPRLGVVDLGLPSRTLWAERNIGAPAMGRNGMKFAWGEPYPKVVFSRDDYSGPTSDTYTGKYNLSPEEDAATVLFGSEWRMPTVDEFRELIQYSTASVQDNVVILKSKMNGATLRIPFYCKIWTATTPTIGSCPFFYWCDVPLNEHVDYGAWEGMEIRPVKKK